MNILSEEFFLSKYRHSSPILNENATVPMERDIVSLKHFLEERVHPDKGSLKPAEKALKDAQVAWDRWNNAQRVKAQMPMGDFLEKINECSARVKIIKEEVLFLDKMITKLEAEQEEIETKEINSKRRYRLSGHLDANGKYDELDGRKVVNDTFQDNGEKVETYIQEALKYKEEQAIIKRKAAEIAAIQKRKEFEEAEKEFDQQRAA